MPPLDRDNAIGSEDSFYRSQFNEPEINTNPQSGVARDALVSGQPPAKPVSNYVPFLDRLRALPEVRAIPWRPGQELPPERAIDSPRVQQRGATLLSTRGAVAPTPCDHCSSGYGRFSVCVTLEHWFQGACSSCIFTSKGNKCSLRTQTSGIADGRALRYHADNPDQLQSYIRNAADQPPKPHRKRKRSSVPSLAQPVVNTTSTYTSIYPQLDPPVPTSPDLDMLLQAEIAREQSPGEPEPVVKLRQHSRPSQPNVARPRGPSKSTATRSPYQYHIETQKLVPTASAPQNSAPMLFRQAETSISLSATRQERSTQGPSSSVIDTLPKAKQRQIYSIISTIQGGIDHLQKQLESLKSHLGIEDDNTVH